jgi:prophage antirepressor-like protein
MSEENAVQVFEGEGFGKVRVIMEGDKPLFVAKDIVEALGLTWRGDRIAHVPSNWRSFRESKYIQDPEIAGSAGSIVLENNRRLAVLTEEGVNFFVIRSDSPKALPVQEWLAGTVMPSIRRTGGYNQSNIMEIASKPENIVNMAKTIVQFDLRIKELEGKIEEDAPKLVLIDSVLESKDALAVGVVSKFMSNRYGGKIGRDRLFKLLRDNKYFYLEGKVNVLTQKGARCGWFKQIERNVNGRIYIKIYVTTKGQVGIASLLRGILEDSKGERV